MAHYAFLDDQGIVTSVTVGRDENLLNWAPATLGD